MASVVINERKFFQGDNGFCNCCLDASPYDCWYYELTVNGVDKGWLCWQCFEEKLYLDSDSDDD